MKMLNCDLSAGTRIIFFGGIGKLGMNKECFSFDVSTFQWYVLLSSQEGTTLNVKDWHPKDKARIWP